MNLARKPHGAVLSFIVASIFILVLVGIAFAALLMLMGGSRQGTNANDAGNLNVAKCAPSIQVVVPSAGADFLDISSNSHFDLTNINEVWGKTLLINLNEQAMRQRGLSTPASSANAGRVWTGARDISARLSEALNTQAKMVGFHQSVADRNRVNMLTPDRTVDVTGRWRTSCMNRGAESNIIFVPEQLPPGITLPSLGNPVVQVKDPKTGKQVFLWSGYRGIAAAGRTMNFVPFEYGSIPHHVSLKPFVANTLAKAPLPGLPCTVPNAFESVALVKDSSLRDHLFDSVALASMGLRKPTTPPQVNGGFIRISLTPDTVNWYPYLMHRGHYDEGMLTKSVSPGTYFDGHVDDPTIPTASFEVGFNYGHQYAGGTLHSALFAMSSDQDEGMYGALKNLIVQRANEINPGATWSQIAPLLHSVGPVMPGDEYIIRRKGSTKHFEIIKVIPDSVPHADGGTEKSVDGVITDSANQIVHLEHKMAPGVPPHGGFKKWWTEWHHQLHVTPGTGSNGALLDIRQQDYVDAKWVIQAHP